MKGKKYFAYLCLGMSICLSACGENKQDEVTYVEQDRHVLGIPETYSDTLQVEQATIKIDAEEIEYPKDTEFKRYTYHLPTADAGQKQKIVEAVFDKKKGVYKNCLETNYSEMCRDDLKIVRTYQECLKQYYLDNGERTGVSVCEENLREIDACESGAPKEREQITDYTGYEYVGYIGDCLFVLKFTEEDGEITGLSLDTYLGQAGMYAYHPSNEGEVVYIQNKIGDSIEQETDDGEVQNACAKNIQTAQDEAVKFLSLCGITNIDMIESEPLGWQYMGETIQTEYDGYCFQFVRTFGGTEGYTASTETFSAVHRYTSELFTVCVDDNGIVNAKLYLVGDQTKEESIGLKEFDDIIICLKENASDYYEKHQEMDIPTLFNYMELSYMLIQKSDERNGYEYKPVWILAYYSDIDTCYAYNYFYYPDTLLALDAETGNIVDYLNMNLLVFD